MQTQKHTPEADKKITATIVSEEQRLDFLARFLGQRSGVFEQTVYAVMDKACPTYNGGYWHFYELSNGGLYIAPTGHVRYELTWADNLFTGDISADATGIATSLMALNWEEHYDLFEKLREYALEHAEAAMILRFID